MPDNKKKEVKEESKKPEFIINSWEDVGAGIDLLRTIDDTIDLLTSEKNKKLKEIEDEYADLVKLSEEKTLLNFKISEYVGANRHLIPGGGGTFKSQYGEVSTRDGKPALTLRTKEGTWDKVITGLESLFKGKKLKKFVKYDPSLQKENIKDAMNKSEITKEQAKELGIRITTGLSVIIKLYKEESK